IFSRDRVRQTLLRACHRVGEAFYAVSAWASSPRDCDGDRTQPVVMMGNWMLVTGLASLFAGDFSGMIPEPTGTTAVATNAGYAKLFAELGAGSLAVGVVLVVLIPFLRKLITDKAEVTPAEMETTTVVPVA